MNENTGNSGNGFFYDLLDNPADLSHSNAFNLQLLINDFPQSGLLRSMLAVKREEESLQSASAYVNPKLLYKIATAVGSLPAVSDEQIAFCEKPHESKAVLPMPGGVELPNLVIDETNYFHVPIDPDVVYTPDEDEIALLEDDSDEDNIGQDVNAEVSDGDIRQDTENDVNIADESETEVVIETAPSSEIDNEATYESETEEGIETVPSSETDSEVTDESIEEADTETEETVDVSEESGASVETETEKIADKEEAQPVEIEDVENVEEESDPEQSSVEVDENNTENPTANEEEEYMADTEQGDNAEVFAEDSKTGEDPIQSDQEIDDEVFEEIVSIEDIGLEQLAIINKATDEDDAEKDVTDSSREMEETPAGDSYFVFEPTLPEDEEHHITAKMLAQNTAGNKGRQHVSRYNDEKMPYSFMWWLDKTRKEHASIYQPFAAEGKFHTETVNPAEKPQPAADHLQQQYVENIFAVTAVVSDLNVTPPKVDAPPVETKADRIIEKFIHEEPQIKHPSKIKLDSENKAKKSSEDRDELVTETLAKIYTEQMLYHKAILTYKKLMLKFPEKSLYFAGQIEQLENKIN